MKILPKGEPYPFIKQLETFFLEKFHPAKRIIFPNQFDAIMFHHFVFYYN